jgi:hypothetical protein
MKLHAEIGYGRCSPAGSMPYAVRMGRTVLSLWKRDIMVMIHSKDTPSDDDWTAHLDRLREWLPRTRAPGLMVLSSGGGPTSAQRQRLVGVVHTATIRVALLSDSAVLRGINTAIGWFLRSKSLKSFSPTRVAEAVRHLGLGPEAVQDAAEMIARIVRLEPSLRSLYVTQIHEQLSRIGRPVAVSDEQRA